MQYPNETSDDCTDNTLFSAAKSSHTDTAPLKHPTFICSRDVGLSLRHAAYYGHTCTIAIVLEKRTDIYHEDIDWALQSADSQGHTQTTAVLKAHKSSRK